MDDTCEKCGKGYKVKLGGNGKQFTLCWDCYDNASAFYDAETSSRRSGGEIIEGIQRQITYDNGNIDSYALAVFLYENLQHIDNAWYERNGENLF